MWGQQWNNVYDLVAPFPEENDSKVTESLRRKNLTLWEVRLFSYLIRTLCDGSEKN